MDRQDPAVTLDQYEQLCKHLAGNKSINLLTISTIQQFSGKELSAMIPFLKSNPNLLRLELGAGGGEISLGGNTGQLLAKTLASFHTLHYFYCAGWEVNSDSSREIVKALSGHRQLKELKMDNILEDYIGSYEAFALLLQKCHLLSKLAIHGDAVLGTIALRFSPFHWPHIDI